MKYPKSSHVRNNEEALHTRYSVTCREIIDQFITKIPHIPVSPDGPKIPLPRSDIYSNLAALKERLGPGMRMSATDTRRAEKALAVISATPPSSTPSCSTT